LISLEFHRFYIILITVVENRYLVCWIVGVFGNFGNLDSSSSFILSDGTSSEGTNTLNKKQIC